MKKNYLASAITTVLLALLTTATAWAQETITGLTYNSTGEFYEIPDAAALNALASYVNAGNTTDDHGCSGKRFKQTADITLSGTFAMIGTENTGRRFNGTYDGGNFAISGLKAIDSYGAFGLFKALGAQAVLKNIRLISPSFTATAISNYDVKMGAIFGDCINGAHIENCHVISPAFSASNTGKRNFGAIGGEHWDEEFTVKDCCYYSSENLSIVGGSVGKITNCARIYAVNAKGCTVSETPIISVSSTDYFKNGTTITLSATPDPGYIIGYESSDVTITDGAFTMPANDVTVTATFTPDPAHFADNGDDTYTIRTATGWNVFCDLLAKSDKGIFSGKTVVLGDDITVSRMAGGSQHDFTGIFDGQGHTLTFNYTAAEDYCAPFRYVESGCTIRNLHVSGTINTSAKYAAGLIGSQYGAVTISNCRVSITISSTVSGDGTHGGFVATNANASGSALTIEGCLFDGRLLGTGTNNCGGFLGWRNKTVTIRNSLFAPAEVTVLDEGSATFGRNTVDTYNCYYTRLLNDGTNYVPALADGSVSPAKWYNGKATRTVTAADVNVTIGGIALTGTTTQYTVSGITAYSGGGLQCSQTLYYGSGDQVSLTLSHTDRVGYTFRSYVVSAGTLSGSTNPYTLIMPDDDVTVTASIEALSSIELSATSATVFGESKYITSFYNGTLDYQLPEGSLAYTVDANGVFHRIGDSSDVIPHGTAVIIVADTDRITLNKLDSTEVAARAGNIMQGTDVAMEKPEGTVYVLGIVDGAPGFYQFTGSTIPAGKAYYSVLRCK